MKEQFARLCQRVDSLTLRERLIVFGAGLVVIAMSWYIGWGESTLQQHAQSQRERASLQGTLQTLRAQIDQDGAATGPGAPEHDRLRSIERRSSEVQGQIDDYAAELISPTEMARVLEKVLKRQHALRLTRLANLGAEDLLPEEISGEQRLYRHRFEMEFEGPYLNCLAYLEELESLPWRLYWQRLEIDAGDYPVNRIRIEVATLSVHEDWIGV